MTGGGTPLGGPIRRKERSKPYVFCLPRSLLGLHGACLRCRQPEVGSPRASKMSAPGGIVVISYGQGPAGSALCQLPAQNPVYYRAMTPWTRKASQSMHPSTPQEGSAMRQG